ncbi:glycoside hydrolase family 43 protein [Sediminibacterium soli]|uniref:glycoside hydrolase family 43 protein n=1 Tax=Sediminibacterium soli TaxID=2698829 RepID=UPI00137A71D0|nr:glycoside hydrolase family 43 protein [Sediminibacterium soli]NCI46517.1 family 43 glycosylhydrolase [Sediminibacterium soli]
MLFRLMQVCLLLQVSVTAGFSQPRYSSFKPGGQWLDENGVHIDAHGGNLLYVDSTHTFYWYGEHRGTPQGVSCYSSKDLYNWKKEGVVLTKGEIPVLERPKVIYDPKNNRYVMWFHYDSRNYDVAELGVATSDKPEGPFVLKKHFRPNGHESRDIGMYLEPETKKAYIGYAADHVNRTIRMVELTEDYLDITTNDSDINAHCEGPGVLKRRGVYYLLTSQCSGWTPNPGTFYTSSAILGPYTRGGNPFTGDAGNNSFNSQPCFIFKIPGYTDAYLYMGDRWNGGGKPDSEYVFLPITITADGKMEIHWLREWDLSLFTPARRR